MTATTIIIPLLAGLLGIAIGLLIRKLGNQSSNNIEKQIAEIGRHHAELTGRLKSFTQAQEDARGQLNRNLAARLDNVSKTVTDNLKESGEKTTKTLGNIGERLSIIDKAQQQIATLSGQVVELQQILDNKQARGAFGETQLADIVKDGLPESAYDFQFTLSNGKRADCIIRLPKPPGPVVVDSKFPLEAYQNFRKSKDEKEAQVALKQMQNDTLKHAQDIASRYILQDETAEAALMFLPSESIFSEIHLRLPQVVEKCRSLRVYPVSPNTMSLTLNTVRAIMRDVQMREQASLIQKEVETLLLDINRLMNRVGKLRSHFDQASKDIDLIEKSGNKISNRSEKISDLELGNQEKIKDSNVLTNSN